jgi:transposase
VARDLDVRGRGLSSRGGGANVGLTAVAHLVTIPGVNTTAAQILVAEIGVDMSRFPSTGHLLSRAGLCPRQDASAGKHHSTRLRKGAPWLKGLS